MHRWSIVRQVKLGTAKEKVWSTRDTHVLKAWYCCGDIVRVFHGKAASTEQGNVMDPFRLQGEKHGRVSYRSSRKGERRYLGVCSSEGLASSLVPRRL